MLTRSCSLPELRRQEEGGRRWPGAAQQGRGGKKSFVMSELCHLGLSGLPFYKRMRSTTAREALLHAQSSGELGALRATIRYAREELGLEDKLVRCVGKQLSKAERYARLCRNALANDNLFHLSVAMSEIAAVVPRVRLLGLGPGLWEDPCLASARNRLAAWMVHRPTLEGMLEKLQDGPGVYCDAWVQLALAGSDLRTEFGGSITKGLLLLPGGPPTVPLTAALAEGFETPPSEPGEDVWDATLVRLVRVSDMLGRLESDQLDELLLRGGSDGRSGLQAAAEQSHIAVFCSVLQTITGQVVVIQHELHKRLDRKVGATEKLAELLQINPEHLCLHRLSIGGLALRLLVEAGQPSAQQVQDVLGRGAVATEPARRPARFTKELTKWQLVAGCCVKDILDLRAVCRETKDAAEACSGDPEDAAARLERARRDAATLAADVERTATKCEVANKKVDKLWNAFLACMEETRKGIREEKSDAEVEFLKKKDAKAQAMHKDAEKDAAEAETERAAAVLRCDEADRAVEAAVVEHEAVVQVTARTALAAAEAATRFDVFVHTPLVSSAPAHA